VKSIDHRSNRWLGTGSGTVRTRQSLPAAPPHLQAGCAIQPMDPFVIHHQALTLEQDVQPSIAEACALGGMRLERARTVALVAVSRR
jgi:hypothetical protein